MPSVNIYLKDEVYKFLMEKGTPAKEGRKIIEEKYKQEKKGK